jgi:hypothetical protein
MSDTAQVNTTPNDEDGKLEDILEQGLEVVEKRMSFEELKRDISTRYINLLKIILKHIKDTDVDKEKHLRKYEKNMNNFVNTNDYGAIFHYFIVKNLHIMEDLVNKNIDLFLSQKPYLMTGKKKKVKKENSNSTYLFPGNMLRYVLSSLKSPPKGKRVSRNLEINNIFDEYVIIFRSMNDYLDELRTYVEDSFKNSKRYSRYLVVLDNYNEILDGYQELEDKGVSTDEEGENDDVEEGDEGGSIFDSLLGSSGMSGMLENSSIFKLAKELQDDLKDEFTAEDMEGLNDPSKVMASMGNMLQGNGMDSKLGATIGKVMGKLGQKMADGSIKKEALQKDVEMLTKSMGGLSKMFGGNLGNIAGLFGGK